MAANTKRLLVPTNMAEAGRAVLAARADVQVTVYPPSIAPAELHALLRDAAGIALSYTPFRRAELDAAPVLEVVARVGVGFDAVEVPALTARGVPLMIAGTANARSVAEHALYFMFALAKRGAVLHRMVRAGLPHDRKADMPMELSGKTVLVVGFGRIGSRVAPRCRALEMTVLVHDPYVPADAIRAAGCEPVADLDAALPRADIVTLHCPKTPETVGLFGAARLARMKPGALLINTARGGLVDETALHAALTAGHLAGAALDVFDPEPPPPTHPLLHLETVVTSPHMAGVTQEAADAMAVAACQNMLDVLDGTPNRAHAVNPEVLR